MTNWSRNLSAQSTPVPLVKNLNKKKRERKQNNLNIAQYSI